jgi:hypothetical protein
MHTPTLFSSEPLTIYLNDHLAGATTGAELAVRIASANENAAFHGSLERLAHEIDEDRESLITIMTGLEVPIDRAKVALGWTAEKVSRLKPNGQLRGYSPLSRLLELEGLLAGIQAKQALWRALIHAGLVDRDSLNGLIARARRQVATVQRLQGAAAPLAIATNATREEVATQPT